MDEEVSKACDNFIKKAKTAGYCRDVFMIAGVLALGKHNKGDPKKERETFEKLAEFAEKYPGDEDSFVKAAGALFGY